ncbi:acylneuraminate cytidylyltransferase family protein [Bremerella alba]|uniref:CMP-N,N'-diacetyllegionaminic acid synthase n=1 Tax=Bremerella alba TaxID=980252 RepID=A0A7V8V1E3_9BACT|nr:acylneuraminate cytidylyltransferase family protein [Bremerella alba]MBA2112899.1 CMP-N,N'-diacetyllegionaminic acid synthase [Bremerella alba]
MIQDKRVLVVVPARGGSKGVKLKNIRPLAGRPLIHYTAELVQQLNYVDRAVVSTDHIGIAAEARAVGLDVPFYRPATLSGDRVGDLEVLQHALIETEKIDNVAYDIIVMLQPTCPQRKLEHVTQTIERFAEGDYDAVWTVSPTDLKYHPLKQLQIDSHGNLNHFDQRGRQIIARQQLQPTYTRNGAAYAISRSCLLEKKSIMGDRVGAVVIEEPLVSIDTLEDMRQVERLVA